MKKVIISGNLGHDAETKKVNEETVMAFSVVVNEKRKDMPPVLFNVLNYRNDEKLLSLLKKGTRVNVMGELTVNNYGEKTKLGVISNDIEIIHRATAQQE